VEPANDSESSLYGAAYSDIIFAKRNLITLCETQGWPYTPWQDFDELRQWLDETVAAWRLDPSTIPVHKPRPFICGPEVWGPGRSNPPPRI
jgi:hypothetical protein